MLPKQIVKPDGGRARHLALLTIGIATIALSARLTLPVPGSQVPQSAQTLAVLLVGSFYGARMGVATLCVYLLSGGLGAPVFSDGAGGWAHLTGPTAGYLLGFVLAAGFVGSLADRGLLHRYGPTLCGMVGGHLLILTLGWARLAYTLGGEAAYQQGIAPFLVGGLFKSLIGALIVVGIDGGLTRRFGTSR